MFSPLANAGRENLHISNNTSDALISPSRYFGADRSDRHFMIYIPHSRYIRYSFNLVISQQIDQISISCSRHLTADGSDLHFTHRTNQTPGFTVQIFRGRDISLIYVYMICTTQIMFSRVGSICSTQLLRTCLPVSICMICLLYTSPSPRD